MLPRIKRIAFDRIALLGQHFVLFNNKALENFYL